jgi:beta-lactamase regulating signal transducer with metallopeptidase domain
MNEFLHSLSFVSAAAAGALFSAVWQGTVLAVCVWLCLRLLPALSAAARSVIWLNVFILLVLLHFVPAFAGRSGAPAAGHLSTVHLDPRWSFALAGVWAVLSLARAVQLIVGAIHLRRLGRRAIPVPVNAELQSLLSGAAGARTAQLCASDEVARPSVLGFFRPRILVPPKLLKALSPRGLQQVVLHEMEHLHRADDWTNLLQKMGLVLFPLNPVLLWVDRRLSAERELACDDRVLRSSAGRKAYALCLTHLAEYSILRRSFSLVLGAWERRPELVRRVQRILSQPARSMSRRPAVAATGGLLAGALGIALALSHSPQLVSFVPAQRAPQLAQSLDPHDVGRALGGTPQLVKAAMPSESLSSPGHQSPRRNSVQPAILKRVKRPHPAPSRAGALTAEAAPLPELDRRTVVVLTEWTTYQMRPRVVLAVATDRRYTPGGAAAPARAIPARYAIVPTPNGWLIIRI